MLRLIYRFSAAGAALLGFLGMSCLYCYGGRDLYDAILAAYGVVPFRFPFVDTSGPLAAWECARQGIDVIVSDPCDVLHRSYNYSPLWTAFAGIPLNAADAPVVGFAVDLAFILSLGLLPPPKSPLELVLVLAATLSTMVVFALERANPDVLLFMMTLGAGFLAEGRLAARLLGYGLALLAALLKYYPIMVLIMVFRERIGIFLTVSIIAAVVLIEFWVTYHTEIARGIPYIPRGQYNTDLFSAQNLPFLLGDAAGNAAESQLVARLTGAGLFAALIGAAFARCRRLLRMEELRATLASLRRLERLLLASGSAVIAGCFLAGQNIGYRGVFLLLVIPGLLALSRAPARGARIAGRRVAAVVVLLMWGECIRLLLYRALEHSGFPEFLATGIKIQFWLLRELCWWWMVSFLVVVLADFLRDSPIARRTTPLFERSPVRLS